jgi:hypothetical protein
MSYLNLIRVTSQCSFYQICPTCQDGVATESSSQLVPAVARDKVQVLLKLVGHQDSKVGKYVYKVALASSFFVNCVNFVKLKWFQVSLAILSLVKPLSVHVGVDLPTAGLWLNYLNGQSEELALRFSEHIPHLVTNFQSGVVNLASRLLL